MKEEKIYPLLITCYDHLAEYRRKHQTMKKYAQLLYPENREKQAEWMKKQADRLITEGEISGSIAQDDNKELLQKQHKQKNTNFFKTFLKGGNYERENLCSNFDEFDSNVFYKMDNEIIHIKEKNYGVSLRRWMLYLL